MKRIITIEVEADHVDSLSIIEGFIKPELRMSGISFDLDNMKISEKYVDGECFMKHDEEF